MATRLFFHDVANALSGTFPTGEQSSVLTATKSVSGSDVLLTMNSITGTAMVARSVSGSQTIAAQSLFCAFFCSDTFDVDQPVGGGNQVITLNIANRQSSLNMNFGSDLRTSVYVWRPSTGAVVGYVNDGGAMTGDAEPSASLSIRANNASVTSTTTVNALAGDVLICEVWQNFTQSSGLAFTGAVYYDGTTVTTTTNTTITSQASFLNFSASTLTFGTPPVLSISCSFGQSLAAATLSGVGGVELAGSFDGTLSAATLSGAGDVVASGSFANTLGDATLAGTGLVGASVGTFNNTLGSMSLSASASIPHVSTFGNTLGALTEAATGSVALAGSFANTLGAVTLTGEGSAVSPAPSEGTFDNALGALTVAGEGSIPLSGQLSATLGASTLAGEGAVVDPAPSEGTFENTLDRAVLVAEGSTGAQPRRDTQDDSAGSGGARTGKRKKFVVPSVEQVPYVDRMFDDLKRQPAPKVVETPKLVPRSTLIADSLAMMAPTLPPPPAPLPQVEVLEPDDDSDMIMIAMLL